MCRWISVNRESETDSKSTLAKWGKMIAIHTIRPPVCKSNIIFCELGLVGRGVVKI